MVASMVAPQLDRFDLWVQPISENSDDANVLGFLKLLAAPLQATTNGAPLPHVVSVSYGECESTVSPVLGVPHARRAHARGRGRARDHRRRRGRRHRLIRVRPRRPAGQADLVRQEAAGVLAGELAWVLAVGGTNLTLNSDNSIASTGPGTTRPTRRRSRRPGWRRRAEHLRVTAVVAARAVLRELEQPDGARHAAFADESPGYPIVCSSGVQSCPKLPAAGHRVRRRHERRDAARGRHDRLWTQQAKKQGLPRPGFVPPLIYATAKSNPGAFIDITQGTNALFGGSCCPARPGYDLATGLGSPMANQIAALPGG